MRPKAACADLSIVALCSALYCVLVGDVTFGSLYGGNLRGGGGHGDRERTINSRKQNYEYTTCTYRYLVLRIIYLVLVYARKKAQHSLKLHRTARQGTAPHGIARRCAAELYIAVGLAELGVHLLRFHKK